MKAFTRAEDGTVVAETDADETRVLSTLAIQMGDLFIGGDISDPAMQRLLPDAYPDDDAASAEFRRFTSEGLINRKAHNARVVTETLGVTLETGELRLDAGAAGAWLRWLTDIRLVIASRLGIESEDEADGRDIDPMMRDIFDWLGFIQNSLVEVLDA